jgi:glycosyltransferase involved in cell wall biosynthesis
VKIALISSCLNVPDAGVAGVNHALAEALRKAGAQADLYFFEDIMPGRSAASAGGRKLLPAFPLALAMSRDWRGYDVIDTASNELWLLALRQHLSNRKSRPLLVNRSHGLDQVVDERLRASASRGEARLSWKYPLYTGGFRLWEVRQSMKLADRCLLLNEYDRHYAIERLGVEASRTDVVDNGVANSLLALPAPIPRGSGQPLRIAQIGGYIERKGIRFGNAALVNVLARYPQVEMLFLGTGRPREQVLADFPEVLHPRIQVRPRFQREELPALLAGHQIKLFPSLFEGFGMAVVEAMACGLAPVVTDIPGVAERLQDGIDALIVPPGDAGALEKAIGRLIAGSDELERIRQSAWNRARSFSWDTIAVKTLDIYRNGLSALKR